MDLKTFIQQTLVQLSEGIESANEALKDSTAKINPRGIAPREMDNTKFYGYLDEKSPERYRRIVQEIEFDVAVHVTEGSETKGGIGIVVGAIGLGSQGKSQAGSASESRIRFTVPMVLPYPK